MYLYSKYLYSTYTSTCVYHMYMCNMYIFHIPHLTTGRRAVSSVSRKGNGSKRLGHSIGPSEPPASYFRRYVLIKLLLYSCRYVLHSRRYILAGMYYIVAGMYYIVSRASYFRRMLICACMCMRARALVGVRVCV